MRILGSTRCAVKFDSDYNQYYYYITEANDYIVFEDPERLAPGPRPIARPLPPEEPIATCVNCRQLNNCKFPLNVVVCGAVDAGKSTMLKQLLKQTNSIVRAVANFPKKDWMVGQRVDGNKKELTVDPTLSTVYHVYDEPKKQLKINLIDTPGHYALKLNLYLGAIYANAAIVVVDIPELLKGERLPSELKELLFSLYIFGIREYIILMNKFDLLNYNENAYVTARDMLTYKFTEYLDAHFEYIPLCCKIGTNLLERDSHMPWYCGPTAMKSFESIDSRRPLKPKLDLNDQNALYCHVFQLLEGPHYTQAVLFVENNLLRPDTDLVALPRGKRVNISSCTTEEVQVTDTRDGHLIRSTYINDFVTDAKMGGVDFFTLAQPHILTDVNTYERMMQDPNSPSNSLWCSHTLVAYITAAIPFKQGLCTGYSVEILVGGAVEKASVGKVYYLFEDHRSRSYCIPPGDFGVIELHCQNAMYVCPVDLELFNYRDFREILSPHLTVQKDIYIPMLARVLIKKANDIIGGGIILRE